VTQLHSFLGRGVFSCYQPVPAETPLTEHPTRFNPEDWAKLTFYSHRYKRRAFEAYSSRYLKTSGQIYWADWQLSAAYVDNYHADLDRGLHAKAKGSEMITELYVPRDHLLGFMNDVRRDFRLHGVDFIYGTIRLIEAENDSALAWAREPWACVIFNLHIDHRPVDIERAAGHFRRLIDHSLHHGGSYFLTYHRFARRDQLLAAHPGMPAFLGAKRALDPGEVFQSNWYRHLKELLA